MGGRDLAGLADGDLVALAKGGRPGAYAAIVTRHKAALYRLILAHVRDADEALDLVQESFVAGHGALDRFDETRSLRAWLAARLRSPLSRAAVAPGLRACGLLARIEH